MISNPSSGRRSSDRLVEEARARLRDLREVHLDDGADLGRAVREAVAEGRVVVAAGGDGTVNAVVHHLGRDGVLGVLPAGTLNHFARDLGIREPGPALAALESGRERRVDVGRASLPGGRETCFVNTVALGIYPDLVRRRERWEGRVGKKAATAVAAVAAFARTPPLAGRVAADGDERRLRAWALLIGNNRFAGGSGRLGERERLDEGVLELWILLNREGRSRAAGAIWRSLRGKPWRDPDVIHRPASEIEIHLPGRPSRVSLDGEVLEPPVDSLRLEIVPGGVRVLVPSG